MKSGIARGVDRRYALGGIVAATSALVMPRQIGFRAITQRGMVGGGLVELGGRHVQFSVFASRFSFADTPDIVVGSVLWSDPDAGYELASATVSAYEIIAAEPARGEVRQVDGTVVVNGSDVYPFTMTLIDAGLPGTGLDSIALVVGDGAATGDRATPVSGLGFSYAAAGPVTIGDLQDVDLEIDSGGTALGGTPTP